jgi:Flp pilus assembly protein TadD
MKRRIPTSSFVAVVAVLVAACGGDDGDRLSKEEFIAKADAICKAANQRETAAGAPGAVLEIKQGVLEKMVPNLRKALADLRELEAPEGDEDKVAKIVSDLEHVHSGRKDQLAGARANNSRAESEGQKAFIDASTDLGASAGPYGLTYCQALGF